MTHFGCFIINIIINIAERNGNGRLTCFVSSSQLSSAFTARSLPLTCEVLYYSLFILIRIIHSHLYYLYLCRSTLLFCRFPPQTNHSIKCQTLLNFAKHHLSYSATQLALLSLSLPFRLCSGSALLALALALARMCSLGNGKALRVFSSIRVF